MEELPVGREKAREILTAADMADEFDPRGNYFVRVTDDRRELLFQAGLETPLLENRGIPMTTTWL